jgi:hypothetical protein
MNYSKTYKNMKFTEELIPYVRFEVFTAVTMMNVVFWNIRTQFVPHRKHITSPL